MRGTLQKLRAFNQAWNRRAWTAYAALLDEELEAFVSGEERPHGKAAHVDRALAFCETFPDASRHPDYLELFASADGQNTLSVVRFTGTAMSMLRLPGPAPAVPTACGFDVTVLLTCHWRAGRIVRLREHLDQVVMARQLGGAGDPTNTGKAHG